MTTQNQTQSNSSQNASFDTILQQGSFPTKEQSIVIDNIKINDYTVAIGRNRQKRKCVVCFKKLN